jgi:two-component system NtrC family response regulator
MIGALYLDTRLSAISKAELSSEYLKLFGLFAATTVQTRQLSQREKELEGSLLAIKEHERHEREQKVIDDERAKIAAAARKGRLDTMLGRSTVIDKLYSFIDKVAPTDVSVLITGETGTGKGVAARAIHELSNRKLKPFITIDCASIPSELLESELFGYEKGAFTGAAAQKKGRIEMAEEGTLFLDEIGDMSLGLQAKLLRFLQERSFERVGGNKTIVVNVRVIAATNKELKSAVANKSFREDLYYRLCGVQLHVPPLRERGDDAYVLAVRFLDEIIKDNNLPVKGFTPEAKNAILSYSWQGNIRQLKNVINRAAILCPGDHVGLDDLGFEPGHGGSGIGTLKEAREDADKRVIQQHLLMNRRNLSKSARTLDIDRGTLRELMKRYGIAEVEEG